MDWRSSRDSHRVEISSGVLAAMGRTATSRQKVTALRLEAVEGVVLESAVEAVADDLRDDRRACLTESSTCFFTDASEDALSE